MKTYDLVVRGELTIVTLDGFEPAKTEIEDDEGSAFVTESDPLGSANWLVAAIGCRADVNEDDSGGPLLWTDYDTTYRHPWRFSVLVDSGDVDYVTSFARENNYDIVKTEVITEPCQYGDSHTGTVAICKHPEGWIILEN